MASHKNAARHKVLLASVTPLASILGSGLLIIVPVLERTLGALAVVGAVAISALAWLVGTVIRHNVRVVEHRHKAGTLDRTTKRLDRVADGVIVIAYVISVALYLRIMAQYLVGFFDPGGSVVWERMIACVAVVVIIVIGVLRGFEGLDRLDRVSLVAVLILTTVLGGVLLFNVGVNVTSDSLSLPPVPVLGLDTVLILGGIVITVQGFETVRYLGDEYSATTRINASRFSQLIAASIYIGFVAVATPAMGLGTPAGADETLLDITGRIAPWLAIPLVLSAVLSQFAAAVADTAAADGNLRGINKWFAGPRAFLVSGVAAVVMAATLPLLPLVAIASRAFAAYYGIQAVIALRTSRGFWRKLGYGTLAVVMFGITVFAQPAG